MNRNKVLDGIMGLCVGDAMGVPLEFKTRLELSKNPVVDMRGHGTYDLPKGTWSDDTSLNLCLMQSLLSGLDYYEVMLNFDKWYRSGAFSANGVCFDIGITTRKAISKFKDNVEPLECGGSDELSNGSGSLMRILPTVYYLRHHFGDNFYKEKVAMEIIHNISKLTHAHTRSLIACGIYCLIANELLDGNNIKSSINEGMNNAKKYYGKMEKFEKELSHYDVISVKDLLVLETGDIESSGYVVDTLIAALWTLLKTNTYEKCILKAVNLGNDTDTIASISGGLAGIYYGVNNIPTEWISKIKNKEFVENICDKFSKAFENK